MFTFTKLDTFSTGATVHTFSTFELENLILESPKARSTHL